MRCSCVCPSDVRALVALNTGAGPLTNSLGQRTLTTIARTSWHLFRPVYLSWEGFSRFYCFVSRCWLIIGFLACRLLGFSASCWFMRLLMAFWLWLFESFAFPIPLWQVAFLRWFMLLLVALAFRISAFPVPLRAFWLVHPFIGSWRWLPASSASPISPSRVLYMHVHVCLHVSMEFT